MATYEDTYELDQLLAEIRGEAPAEGETENPSAVRDSGKTAPAAPSASETRGPGILASQSAVKTSAEAALTEKDWQRAMKASVDPVNRGRQRREPQPVEPDLKTAPRETKRENTVKSPADPASTHRTVRAEKPAQVTTEQEERQRLIAELFSPQSEPVFGKSARKRPKSEEADATPDTAAAVSETQRKETSEGISESDRVPKAAVSQERKASRLAQWAVRLRKALVSAKRNDVVRPAGNVREMSKERPETDRETLPKTEVPASVAVRKERDEPVDLKHERRQTASLAEKETTGEGSAENGISTETTQPYAGLFAEKKEPAWETEATKIIPIDGLSRRSSPAVAERTEVDEPDLDQMNWEQLGIAPESPKEEAPDESLAQALQEARQKQLEHFRQKQESDTSPIRLLGEEEERNDPEEEPEEEPAEEELMELTSYEEGKTVLRELRFRRTTGLAITALTVLLELILVALSLVTALAGGIQTDVVVFLIIQLVLLGVMMAGNHHLIREGMAGLLHGKPSADTAAALPSLLVLGHTLLQFVSLREVAMGRVELLTALAGFQLMVGAMSRQTRLNRIHKNATFAASPKQSKQAARRITDEKTATLIGHNAVAGGVPLVTYFKRTPFLQHFLAYAYDRDCNEKAQKRYLPLVGATALAAAVLYAVLTPEATWMVAVTVFVTLAAVGLPTVSLVAGWALSRAAYAAHRSGVMLSGQVAVEEFGDMDGLVLDAADLFSHPGGLRLLGIKTFADAQIDTAILDAAAVCIKAGSPLAGVFRQVIENREDYLQEVDTLVYEQDMGVSGWVGGRRVLVGSRQLLQNHGVDVPSGDFERRYLKEKRKLVYLSTAGELSALFVVSYHADPAQARALRDMTRCGVSLLVRSCDPNITEELLCDLFQLDDYYVEVLSSAAGCAYVSLTQEAPEEEEEAVLATTAGNVYGMVRGLTLCHRLRQVQRFLSVWQAFGTLLLLVGYALSLLVGHMLLPVPLLLGVLTGWTVLALIGSFWRLR